MTSRFVKVLVPSPVAIPRGAEWASALRSSLARIGRDVWRRLETVGQARADRKVQRLARQYAQPEFAQALRNAMHRAAMHRDSQH